MSWIQSAYNSVWLKTENFFLSYLGTFHCTPSSTYWMHHGEFAWFLYFELFLLMNCLQTSYPNIKKTLQIFYEIMKRISAINFTHSDVDHSQVHKRRRENAAIVLHWQELEQTATAAATHQFNRNFNHSHIRTAWLTTIITTACRHPRRFQADRSQTFSLSEIVHQITRHLSARHQLPTRLRATAHR